MKTKNLLKNKKEHRLISMLFYNDVILKFQVRPEVYYYQFYC